MDELFSSAANVSRIIQLILAPAVIISACAIIVGGLVSRAAAINDRLRNMNRERLDLLETAPNRALAHERIEEIDRQLPNLLHRLRLTHNAVLSTYGAILVLIIDMLLIAVAALTNSVVLGWSALVVFLSGAGLLGLAAVLTIQELQKSMDSINYEVARVSSLMFEAKEKKSVKPVGLPK